MDIKTCIDEYLKMAPDVFPVEGWLKGNVLGKLFTVATGRQRFDPKPLESAIRRLVEKYLEGSATEGKDTTLRFRSSHASERHECKV